MDTSGGVLTVTKNTRGFLNAQPRGFLLYANQNAWMMRLAWPIHSKIPPPFGKIDISAINTSQ
jgi:hypothetical protein